MANNITDNRPYIFILNLHVSVDQILHRSAFFFFLLQDLLGRRFFISNCWRSGRSLWFDAARVRRSRVVDVESASAGVLLRTYKNMLLIITA